MYFKKSFKSSSLVDPVETQAAAWHCHRL